MAKEALQKAVSSVGSQTGVARSIGGKVKQQHVWDWLNDYVAEVPPAEHVISIERATVEAFLEGRGEVVDRYELRPDVFGTRPEGWESPFLTELAA